MEKLYELSSDPRFETVVVDTPPTRNALDLLDSPRRLTHFLENRLFRALLVPTRAYLRAVTLAAQALLRTISKVAGAEIVQDAMGFFEAFQGMEQGFHDRAAAVQELLADPATAYVIITSPRPDALDEAAFFLDRLEETGVSPAGLVVNRVHPHFAPEVGTLPTAVSARSDLAVLIDNLHELDELAAHDASAYADLAREVRPAPVGSIPLLEGDVHDLSGLAAMADHLFAAPQS